jgi:hypothetical protein
MKKFTLHAASILATSGAVITTIELIIELMTHHWGDSFACGVMLSACLCVAWWAAEYLKKVKP